MWIRLPGIATSSGSRHDKRILCNIQRCIQNAHNTSCDIFFLQDARARVWKHAVTRELCANLLELDIRWCLFNDFLDPATNLPYSRITKVYTNVILPEALTAPCVHANHVCSKTVSPDVIALFCHKFVSVVSAPLTFVSVGSQAEFQSKTILASRHAADAAVNQTQESTRLALPVQKGKTVRFDDQDLGDHEDTGLAHDDEKAHNSSVKKYPRNKRVPCEDHYDDCGDDDSCIAAEVDGLPDSMYHSVADDSCSETDSAGTTEHIYSSEFIDWRLS